jgi:hypothetical protein
MSLTCLLNPGPCIATGWHNLIATVPWWVWVIIALVAIGLVWKLAGVPGLIAAAFGAGFAAGYAVASQRTAKSPAAPAPKRTTRLPFPPLGTRPKTLQDMFRDGLK